MVTSSRNFSLELAHFRVYFVVVMQRTYEFKKEDGSSVKEDVGADVKENFVRYHVTDNDGEVTVIDDFNRVSKISVKL